jgi:curved DNA-binding protein CbpA
MSKIEIDFNNLKYNLYELLNVQVDADSAKIKKNFMKIIKTFHPDKNSELEEDIYCHIILANQILLNNESRKKYDEYINDTAETFYELKQSFNKSIANYSQEKDCIHEFNKKFDALNKKHGYKEFNTLEPVIDKFNKTNRDDIKIEKESFTTLDDFNKKFNNSKLKGGKLQDQIIEYKNSPQELSTYVIGEKYTNLQDIDKLYIEDSIQSSKFSSLDRAFMLHPNYPNNIIIKTSDEKMKEYKAYTQNYQNMKPSEFSTKKFNEW